jgi:eukaryotic-like serine/threonine-protein kinase
MIGKTLGHYQITEKLGEGGMGVVYKARDTHLDRFVAIKVLAAEKVADPDRKRRFVQEAKAASALNHPNIIHVYDIDQAEGTDFIAMEYVGGRTLAQLIPRRGMQLGEALKYAIQIADALARAHGAGIVHRDLKPSNVIVDEHGLVKVLDFGLAKLTEAAKQETNEAETAATGIEEGTVFGTPAYMSPEQAEGKRVDPRSDIFSFGSMFYEMLTAQRAFQGETRLSTIASILREEPKPISQLVNDLPREVERVIRRCLRKDPEHRFQTMADLRVALEELREESESGVLETAGMARPRSGHRLIWTLGVVAAFAVAAIALWFIRPWSKAPEESPTAVPLTAYAGDESMPSFSPDGSQVAFMWDGAKEDNFDIYVKLVGAEPPLRLTTNPAFECSPAWSPDGRWIAFLRILPGGKADVVLISPIGGPERILTETYFNAGTIDAHYLAWSPDSRWLVTVGGDNVDKNPALFLRSVETGEQRRLTDPPANCLGDSCPSLSPDGRILAFFRWTSWSNSDLHLLYLTQDLGPIGEPKQLTFGKWRASSPAWTADGKAMIFSAASNLWRVDASGTDGPHRVTAFGGDGAHPAISRQGNRLAYAQAMSDIHIYRIELTPRQGKANPPEKFIYSTRGEYSPQFSPNGKKIAFVSERSGSPEVWVCEADGSNAVQLTFLRGPNIGNKPSWSPDSRRLSFEANIEGHPEVYVIDAGGGNPQRLTSNPAGSGNPSWSKDGRWIFFDTTHVGIQKVPVEGGPPVLMTDRWGWGPIESPDGRFIYTIGWSNDGFTLLRAPAEGGEARQVLDSLCIGQNFVVAEDGIYFMPRPDPKAGYSIQFLDSSAGTIERIASIEKPVSPGLTVSPDRRWILYAQVDHAGSDLMLVENFR